MKLYDLSLQNKRNSQVLDVLNIGYYADESYKLIVKKILSLIILIHICPLSKEVEFNRGTVHYVRHITLSFCRICYISNSLFAGVVSSLLIYFLINFICRNKDEQDFSCFEKTVNNIIKQQQSD